MSERTRELHKAFYETSKAAQGSSVTGPVEAPKKRFVRQERSLILLLQALCGRKVALELRNDILIKATELVTVDEFMNVTLRDVTVKTVQGSETRYESMFIKGRNIRYVHLPAKLEPEQVIEQHKLRLRQIQLAGWKERQKAKTPEKGAAGAEDWQLAQSEEEA